MHSLVSIIVPVYNAERYIDNCIDTLVNQTYPHIEIILINDGSPDNSPAICDRWAKRDARIKVVHKNNGGVSDARNCGLKSATGDYIMFVDSDDWVELNFVEVMVTNIRLNDVDIVNCQYVKEKVNGKIFNASVKYPSFVKDNIQSVSLLIEDSIVTSHLWRNIFNVKLFDGVKFPKGKNYEDIYVMHELFFKSKRILFIGDVLYHYFCNENSIVHTKSEINFRNGLEVLLIRDKFLCENIPELSPLLRKKISNKVYNKWKNSKKVYLKTKDSSVRSQIHFCEEYLLKVPMKEIELKKWIAIIFLRVVKLFK